MRMIFSMLCVLLTWSPAFARPVSDAPKPLDLRTVSTTNQFERNVEELRALQSHTDHYLILRLEIEAMRRDNPEHDDFLDRYLNRLMQIAR
jgi:hypothetical protein